MRLQPAAEIAEICEVARARGVAVVFALNRIGLGSVFGTNKRMSGGQVCGNGAATHKCALLCHCMGLGGAGPTSLPLCSVAEVHAQHCQSVSQAACAD